MVFREASLWLLIGHVYTAQPRREFDGVNWFFPRRSASHSGADCVNDASWSRRDLRRSRPRVACIDLNRRRFISCCRRCGSRCLCSRASLYTRHEVDDTPSRSFVSGTRCLV